VLVKHTYIHICQSSEALEGLFIKNFSSTSIKVSAPVVAETEILAIHSLTPEPVPQVETQVDQD